MILKLPLLDDFSRLLTENFRNEVFFITEDKPIKLSGTVLAARSSVLEGMIQDNNNIPAIEFSDNIPGLYSCLRVLYGGSISIDIRIYKSLFKFGKIFQIQEMMECVLKWVSEELPHDMFWDVSQELIKMGVALTSDSFRGAIRRYISSDCSEFWQYTKKLCLDNKENTVGTILNTLSGTDVISSEDMITFLSDLLNVITDKEQAPSPSISDSASEKYVNSVLTYTVSYLENKVKSDINSSYSLCSKYFHILKKLSTVCNEVEFLRKIAILQNDAFSILLFYKEVALCTTVSLTRLLVEKLTNPSIAYDTIRYFTEYAAKDVHSCVIGEIVLKWWSVNSELTVNSSECPDITFIRTLFTKIEGIYDRWLYDANDDVRFGELFISLELKIETGDRKRFYHFCDHDNNNLIALKQCIEEGDGTELTLPTNDIENSYDMEVYKDNMPVFRYNTAIFPPYGEVTDHWYLLFSNQVSSFSMVSLITESQQDILGYFEFCNHVELHFIPSPDRN